MFKFVIYIQDETMAECQIGKECHRKKDRCNLAFGYRWSIIKPITYGILL